MNIGKAKLDIGVRGCIDCGTEHSHHWETARIVSVWVDGRQQIVLEVKRCGHCAKVPCVARNHNVRRLSFLPGGDV